MVGGVVFARAENERVIFEIFRILRRVVLLQVIGSGEQEVVVEPRRPSEKSFGGRFVGKVGNVARPRDSTRSSVQIRSTDRSFGSPAVAR